MDCCQFRCQSLDQFDEGCVFRDRQARPSTLGMIPDHANETGVVRDPGLIELVAH